MNIDEIEIGKTYRMKGRKLDREVVDILSFPTYSPDGEYAGKYRMVVCDVLGGKAVRRRVKEYLPWMAADAIGEVQAHG